MVQMNNGNYDALAWVQNEVQQSLADALQILTRFIDDPQDPASLEPCVTQLHQVMGIMEMLNLEGALLLSQEMLAAATALRSQTDHNTTELQDNLLKGLLLLPNYLKQINQEVYDHPLRLIETINELRSSRNEAALEATELFQPNLSIVLPAQIGPKLHNVNPQNSISIDKVGHAFQVSLVNWIKNNDDTSLGKLNQLVHYLRLNCTHERSIILWWIAEGVIEALNDGGLEVDTKSKLSLGKLNDPIKLLTKHDEQYLISLYPTELVHQLLLLVAQSNSEGKHVRLIKDTFNLNLFDNHIHQKLYSFTDDALVEVRSGILEQLLAVKEQLSQFDRDNEQAGSVINTLLDQLSSLSNALEMITETAASTLLKQHHEDLSQTPGSLPTDSQMMALADDVLRVENQLQQANHISTQHQDQQLQSAVITECLTELANIKETLIQIENGQLNDTEAMTSIAEQLGTISGSTTMLGLDNTSSLLNAMANKMATLQQASPTNAELGVFAEIIAATELYLEGLSQHGQHQTALIEQAQSKLDQFEQLTTEQPLEQVTESSETTDIATPSQEIEFETTSETIELELEAGPAPKAETSVDRYIHQLESTPVPKVETSVDRYIQQFESALAPKVETSVDRYIQQLEAAPVSKAETSVDRYIQQLESVPAPKAETSVDRYIQQLEAAPAPKVETSVDRYIQQLEAAPALKVETSVDRYIQQLESTPAPKVETSVDRYIQQLEAAPTPKAETSVDRYIQQLESAPAPKAETSVDRYIQQLESAPAPKVETSVDRYIQQLEAAPAPKAETSVDRYIQQLEAAPASKTETSVDRYIQRLESAPAPKVETSVDRYIQQLEAAPSLDIDEPQVIEADDDIVLELESISLTPQFAEGIDPDIAEVFIEEAQEVLSELDTLMPHWLSHHEDHETLTTIRRHFHTLKGSGRMAGAEVIGELTWSVENMLNKVMENQMPLDGTIMQFVGESHQLIPDLVSRFTQGDMVPTEAANALQARIEAYDSSVFTPELAIEEPADNELQQIFNDEASNYIEQFESNLASANAPYTISSDLLHAAHALKGAAHTAQATEVAQISDALDQQLRRHYEANSQLDESQLGLLDNSVKTLIQLIQHPDASDNQQLVEAMCQSLNEWQVNTVQETQPQADPDIMSVFMAETEELLEQYQLLRAQLAQLPEDSDYKSAAERTLQKLSETAQLADQPVLAHAYNLVSDVLAEPDVSEPAVAALLDGGLAHITDMLDALKAQSELPTNDDYQYQIEQFYQQAQSIVEPADVEPEDDAPQDTLFTIPETDSDLLGAFTEECAELLESAGTAIKAWQNDPDDSEAALQLQRDLHTLKGGSRLTAITPIADLTHHTESLAIQASEKQCDTDEAFFNLLQRCQDRLADLHDQLSQMAPMAFADDLITEIHRFTAGDAITPETPETLQSIPTEILSIDQDTTAAPVKSTPTPSGEQVRVKAELLDFLTNFAGEVNISRDRVSQQNAAMRQQLSEMESTVERLQEQLRKLEIETEAQILFRYEDNASQGRSDFDPLELDRFSQMQQLSRGLTESVTDLHDITRSIENMVRESDTILLQQSRLSTDLQQGLMNTRLLPFSGLVPRFERIVRQTNTELDKQSELVVYGADRELDRNILDHIVAPIEHLLRNAISHGIEDKETRLATGKEEVAQLTLSITRDGSEILITLSDDGQGIDVEKIRQKALEKSLINPEKMPSDDELIQLILHSGFSTADDVSQLAGRGVGMDVVNSEIRSLKGRLSIQSVSGQGTSFNIRLPLTLSVMQALLIGCADEQYAIPLASVHAGERISIKEVKTLLAQGNEARYEYNGTYYKFMALASLLNQPFKLQDDHDPQLPLLLFNSGEVQIALVVDTIHSSREIVLKSVGEQLGHIAAINGATILGDGQIVFVLDIPTLVSTVDQVIAADNLLNSAISTLESIKNRLPLAMVVDDSITMRKASSNLLKRHGFEVITARDGIDAVALLNDQVPDIILLDVEMPRMDGFEFATLVRNDEQFSHIPIIMITSRSGEKHRNRARDIGVNAYLGKPYQEGELVDALRNLLGAKYPERDE